jgi:dipeptidyl aminopeptidase/acylaminoacyl peptidase
VDHSTYTYKTVGDLAIKADVYRRDDHSVCPVVMSIHGGALIMGNRSWLMDDRIHGRLLQDGYAIVSIDYRLAPETQLREIIEDIEDAYTWLHDRGAELFGVDTERIGVMGGSAGGYLTLATGFRCSPRPAALLSLFGYGEVVGDWYSRPSRHARHQKPKLTQREAWACAPPEAQADATGSLATGQRPTDRRGPPPRW